MHACASGTRDELGALSCRPETSPWTLGTTTRVSGIVPRVEGIVPSGTRAGLQGTRGGPQGTRCGSSATPKHHTIREGKARYLESPPPNRQGGFLHHEALQCIAQKNKGHGPLAPEMSTTTSNKGTRPLVPRESSLSGS